MFHASSMNRLRFRTKDGFDRAASWLTGSRNESREMISFEYSGQPGADQLSQLRSEAKNEGDQRHPSAWGYGGHLVNSGKRFALSIVVAGVRLRGDRPARSRSLVQYGLCSGWWSPEDARCHFDFVSLRVFTEMEWEVV
jgi:hypothetical protein